MATGKDIRSSDGLGGVHKVAQPRQAAPAYQPDPAGAPTVARGLRTNQSRVVADPDQGTRVDPTEPAPIAPKTKPAAPESQEEGARTAEAPLQDARAAPAATSAWEASPTSDAKG
jgi:hypothetical protein